MINYQRAATGILLSLVFLSVFTYVVFESHQIIAGSLIEQNKNVFLSGLSAIVGYAEFDSPIADSYPQKKQSVADLNINAESAISVWTDFSGQEKILFGKNEEKRLPIASITKLMTALIVLDNYDLSGKVTISQDAYELETIDPGRTLLAGTSFTAKELLYVMLIESNTTAAQALSESMGRDRFVELMNLKAKEIGLNDTDFSTPVGRGPTNFSTVKDVVKLLDYIFNNKPVILQITTSKDFSLFDYGGNFLRKVKNTDDLLSDGEVNSRIIGGKTGETKYAGECLALIIKSLGKKNYLVNVVLNSDDRFGEMKKMINWVDSNYQWAEDKAEIKTEPSPEPLFEPAALSWKEATTSAPWQTRDSHTVIVYKDKIWLMGGLDGNGHAFGPGSVDYNSSKYFGDIWSSADGVNWQKAVDEVPWGKRRSMGLADFKGKLWMMGGYSPDYGYRNDIWSTEDGKNWKQEVISALWPVREGQDLLVFQDKMWLIGGVRYDKNVSAASSEEIKLFNDVWYSSDGINWIEATAGAGWAPRWDMAVGVFQDKIWLVGGMMFGGKMYKDVWYSADGANWALAANNPPFTARQGNFLTEYKGKMWLIGRLDGTNGGTNDIWYSDNGIKWEKTRNDPAWFGREDFGAVLFKDKIWILGGMDKNWTWVNDIWYSIF